MRFGGAGRKGQRLPMVTDLDNLRPMRSASRVPEGEPIAIPPRFRWLKRFGWATGVLVVALLLLRVAWGYVAERRLEWQIAEYRALGQLVSVEEFDAELDAVKEDENAAVLYEQAMAANTATSQSGLVADDFVSAPEVFGTSAVDAEELMTANAGVLKLLHDARKKPRVAWSERFRDVRRSSARYSDQRRLSKLLWFAAVHQLLVGNHAESVTTVRDSMALNKAIGSHPTLIASLVAWACDDLTYSVIERYASRLQVSGDGGNVRAGAASRAQVEGLIQDLLDEDCLRKSTVRMCLGSRASNLAGAQTATFLDFPGVAVGPFGIWPFRPIVNYLGRPFVVLDSVRQSRFDSMAAEAVAEKAWPHASARFAGEEKDTTLVLRLKRPMTYSAWRGLSPYQSGYVGLFFKLLATRRMAAIALVIRLYTIDHGEPPAKLDQLVPEYMAALPRDPFARIESTFGYKPLADRPFLYSVAQDGRDNGGTVALTADGRRDLHRSDRLFYLQPG